MQSLHSQDYSNRRRAGRRQELARLKRRHAPRENQPPMAALLRFHRRTLVLALASTALGGALLWAQQAAPPQSDVIVNPFAGNAAAIKTGAGLFESYCAD